MLKTIRTEVAPPDPWEPPKEFDGFVITSQLGQGGMGQVFLARDRDLDRQVAIKFIASDGPIEELRERFLREARAIARLQHPNVVSVFRVGEVREHPYIAYE